LTTAGILHSASARRGALSASLVETALAVDASTTGTVIFATLVDDPASVSDHVDALVGELMVEAASATATVTVSSVRGAAVVEEAAAASTTSAFGIFTYNVSVAEPLTAVDTPDAFVSAIYNVVVDETATAADTSSTFFTRDGTVTETAAADDSAQDATVVAAPRDAMLPDVFVNGTTTRQAFVGSVMVNL
jgi:hypothetical protein